MTCLPCNDGDYGSITLFDVEMFADGNGSSWPAAIRPHPALPRVPKKLIKNMVKDLPQTKKTELRASSKKDELDNCQAAPAYNPDLEQTKLPKVFLEALPVRPSELAGN
ncbi:hypothetical protein Sste5344_004017 [Sporothrix stenoceras]